MDLSVAHEAGLLANAYAATAARHHVAAALYAEFVRRQRVARWRYWYLDMIPHEQEQAAYWAKHALHFRLLAIGSDPHGAV